MREKTSPWFKAFALCTAIGLGGTYVWRQQQKAAPEKPKTVERTVLPGSKSRVIAPTPLPADQEEADRVLMPGSKSSGVLKPEEWQQRTLMPSSKSGIVLPSPELPGEPKQRTLLPGSKSIDRILEIPKTDKP